jgi:hypothetical protein
MATKKKTAIVDSGETDGRLLRLMSCLVFIVEESEKLGYPMTAIEARRAGLQLCYEANAGKEMAMAFADGIRGRA